MIHRRTLLQLALGAGVGLALGGWWPSLPAADPAPAAGRRRRARSLIWIHLAGGMSHVDTLDPKPGNAVMGPVAAIPTSADGIQLGEHLPRLAKQMHHGALIRSLTSTQGAHEQGEYYLRTGYLLRGTARHPVMGSWLAHCQPRLDPTLPAFVTINPGSRHPGAGFLGTAAAPLPVGDPAQGLANSRRPREVSEARFQGRLDLLKELETAAAIPPGDPLATSYRTLYDDAVALMRSPSLAAFDLAAEPAAALAAYGDHAFGKGCCLARRLVEAGVRSVELTLGGWDTHDDHFDRLETQCGILDAGLPTLIEDLAARGLLEDTVVVLASEFGRTPHVNQNQGRDHHPRCFSAFLAGGPVAGGTVWGASDPEGDHPATDPTTVPDFHATVADALGLPLGQVFKDPDGRPFTIGDKGRPIAALVG